MKIFIVGADQVGKTTVAELLGNRLKMPVGETGDMLCAFLARVYAGREGDYCDSQHFKTWVLRILNHKEMFRPQLASLGDLLARVDPRYLVEQCAHFAPIIVGVRRRREVIPFVAKGVEKKNIWIKVRGPNRGALRSSIFELGPYEFDYSVNNFGHLDWLKQNVDELADKIAKRAKL